jgi:hypothetical protein
VYFQDLRESNREPVKVLALMDVAQVDALDDYGLLIMSLGALFVSLCWYEGFLDLCEAWEP